MRHTIFITALLMTFFVSCEKVDMPQDVPKDAPQNSSSPKTDIPSSMDTCYMWNGHIVVGRHLHDDGRTELLLLSLYEWGNMPSANHITDSALVSIVTKSYVETDIEGWHIPSVEEAKLLKTSYGEGSIALSNLNKILLENDALVVGGDARYLCDEGRKSFSFAAGTNISNTGSKATNYRLRLLRQVILP